MTVTYYPGRQLVQESMPDHGQHLREIARTVNLLMRGQSNATLQVTLNAGVTTTTINDARISLQTAPMMVPTTANAAAELASGSVFVTPAKGQAVITHRNNAQTDRTFNVALIG